MRKVFKFLFGTNDGGIPWAYTSNSGSSIMLSLPTSSMPNYKEASRVFTGNAKLDRGTFSGLVNGTYKPTTKPIEKNGVIDYNPSSGALLQEGGGGRVGNIMGTVSDVASNIFKTKPLSTLTLGLDTGYDATADTVMMFNPIVGGFLKARGLATDIVRSLGVGTDQVTTEDQILDSKFLALTPVGLANSLGAKKALKMMGGLEYNNMKADMGAGYGGFLADINKGEEYAGKNIGNLFGQRDRAEKKVFQANYDLAKFKRIYNKGQVYRDIQGTLSDMAFNKLNLRMKGGWQDGSVVFGRHGMVIDPVRLRTIHSIEQKITPKQKVFTETELVEDIQAFKLGGSFNVIPEGALHARLHHMEDAEDLTKKGIPVVVEKEGGELELLAEIELNEIIFRLEVTNEIEKLMKDGSDNAAIECGKMLVKEIFENTQDRTGLIESLKEPKGAQEEVVKEHRVFQEGGVLLTEETPQEKIPTLEEFINSKIQERIEAAILKATTRKSPYMFRNKDWKNCIATATDNFGIPVVLRNSDLEANPEKYGFIRLESDGNIDNLPDGVLILDFNKPGQPNTPGHTVMLVGRDDEGYPLYSYSSGDNDPKSMHNLVRYNFNSLKINVFKYNGTDQEREAWKAEYLANYPEQ